MEASNRISNSFGAIADSVDKTIHPVSRVINGIGMGAITFDMVLIFIDVVCRKAFNTPIKGTYELVEFGMLIMIVLALAYTQMMKGHISVELIVEKFPKRVQAILEVFTNLICLGFWGAIAYQGFFQASEQVKKGITSANLMIPLWPFVIVLAVGCVCFSIVIFSDVLRSLRLATASKAYLDSIAKEANR